MSLSAAAILPHSPLLVPTVGRDNIAQAVSTIRAMKRLAQTLKDKNIDTLIILSSHGPKLEEAFTMNHCPIFKADFEQFGDLITKFEFPTDVGLAYHIKESVETTRQLAMFCEEKLDYSVAVPMFYIQECCPQINLIPMYTSALGGQEHYKLGQLIRPAINDTSKKIAVIAVGDLARTTDEEKTDSSKLKEFNNTIIRLLKNKKLDELKNIKPEILANVNECLYHSLLLLLGVLDDTDFKPNIYSYETPFAVGLLVANLEV